MFFVFPGLAFAVAISLFDLNSSVALVITVGVLVEVSVMVPRVAIANWIRRLFPA